MTAIPPQPQLTPRTTTQANADGDQATFHVARPPAAAKRGMRLKSQPESVFWSALAGTLGAGVGIACVVGVFSLGVWLGRVLPL